MSQHETSGLPNRVDPFGDLHVHPGRGLFTGNRGCLVDANATFVRHHVGRPWIVCVLRYRDWSQALDSPRTWTPLFFLDDAVALAAGHRPCGLCRRDAFREYGAAAAISEGGGPRPNAPELDRRLAGERLTPGRGFDRRADRVLWEAHFDDLPNGAVAVDDRDTAHLVSDGLVREYAMTGWRAPKLPWASRVRVLTPPTSVAALTGGFSPVLHPSAAT